MKYHRGSWAPGSCGFVKREQKCECRYTNSVSLCSWTHVPVIFKFAKVHFLQREEGC